MRNKVTLPAPGTYWTDTLTNRVVLVTGYHTETARYTRTDTILVLYRTGPKAWEVGSTHCKLWDDRFEAASVDGWLAQTVAKA